MTWSQAHIALSRKRFPFINAIEDNRLSACHHQRL